MAEEYNEIAEILENADNEWAAAEDKDSLPLYESAVKLFQLAIKKAGKPLPNVHARLARVYYSMHFLIKKSEANKNQAKYAAKDQADLALKYDPDNLTARFVKVWVKEVDIIELGKLLLARDYKKELEKLLALFQKHHQEKKLGAISALDWGRKLISTAEFCEGEKLFGKKEIYTLLSNLSMDKLDFTKVNPEKVDDLKKEIRSLKIKAESRLL